MHHTLLGQLLVNFGLISEPQLRSALELQRRRTPRRLLGELLVEEGILEESALRGILTVQQRKLDASKPKAGGEDELRRRVDGASLAELLAIARELRASDLHLSPGQPPLVRQNGSLRELPGAALDASRCSDLVRAALCVDDFARLEREMEVDAGISDPGAGRFRVHAFRHSGGIAAALRAIPDEAWEFDQLGLPAEIAQLSRLEQGLVLVTGPIGSGKSTTLGALLRVINRTRRVHVITAEDPVEVIHASDRALFSQREVGSHTASFATALRAALREDPDVLVVGEMRDLETTSIALAAAETGHLVLATAHTPSAERTIHRILDQFPGAQRDHARTVLANVLRAVVCQQLVPTIDGRGRALAHEVLHVTSAVSNLIRDERIHQIPAAMQIGRRDGMQMMDDSLATLVRAKRIALEEALARASDPERFMRPVGAT